MKIEMKKVVLDTTNETTYLESLHELFDYNLEAAEKSFDNHHSFGSGVNIGEVVKDAFILFTKVYSFELHDLGDKKVLLVVAWIEVD